MPLLENNFTSTIYATNGKQWARPSDEYVDNNLEDYSN
jgi:hypothetical protein